MLNEELYEETGVIEGASKELGYSAATAAVAGRWEVEEAGEEVGDDGAEDGGE